VEFQKHKSALVFYPVKSDVGQNCKYSIMNNCIDKV